MSGDIENISSRPAVIYVDVDDTLVRTVGTKRIPMPHVVQHVRELHAGGAVLFLWSRGGEDYAREVATELGIAHCFRSFLPKPTVVIDDEAFDSWRFVRTIHPASCRDMRLEDYRDSHL